MGIIGSHVDITSVPPETSSRRKCHQPRGDALVAAQLPGILIVDLHDAAKMDGRAGQSGPGEVKPMEYRTIEWDREKLYKEIWERPAVQLAKEYGLSDVALAKICKKLKIPKPGVGYWRRRERGYPVSRAVQRRRWAAAALSRSRGSRTGASSKSLWRASAWIPSKSAASSRRRLPSPTA